MSLYWFWYTYSRARLPAVVVSGTADLLNHRQEIKKVGEEVVEGNNAVDNVTS